MADYCTTLSDNVVLAWAYSAQYWLDSLILARHHKTAPHFRWLLVKN
jgi:hypothetical protein